MSPTVPFDPVTVQWQVDDLLGDSSLESLLGRPVRLETVVATAEPYHFGSPATGGLVVVTGEWESGGDWSVFVKVLQHLRHWPFLPYLPPQIAEEMIGFFPWKEELDIWRPALVDRLPDGLRVPDLYGVVELGDDRIAVWMERVQNASGPWTLDTFALAARLIGAFNARMCDQEVLDACTFPDDFALRMWATKSVQVRLDPFEDEALWEHPALARREPLRHRVLAARPHIDDVLRRLSAMRHGMPHGDCSPQNLLMTATGELVMIDISFQTPAPPGTDLAQLVVGLAHAREVPAADLPEVEAVVLAAYADGFRGAGVELDDDDLRTAYAGTLLLRSGFTSIEWDWLDDPARANEIDERLQLTEFVLDTAERHL